MVGNALIPVGHGLRKLGVMLVCDEWHIECPCNFKDISNLKLKIYPKFDVKLIYSRRLKKTPLYQPQISSTFKNKTFQAAG